MHDSLHLAYSSAVSYMSVESDTIASSTEGPLKLADSSSASVDWDGTTA